jgi:pSer/pThr/pTyr-binding forkhead associated (FHA) protein
MAASKEPAGGEAGRDRTVPRRRDDPAADIPGRYAASLIVRSGPKKGAEYRISGSRTVIGRGGDADVLLDDASVSRFHAAIEHSKAGFKLKDLGSTNGTLKDGISIKETALVHGDRFQIGDTTFEFALAETSGKSVYVIEE